MITHYILNLKDGAGPHTTREVLTYLGAMFGNKVIGYKARAYLPLPARAYPADSPDLLQVSDVYLFKYVL